MNKRQTIVLILAVMGIALIFFLTPKYKITWIDSENFIKTEQTSSLYKRSQGKVQLHWDRIFKYSGIVFVTGAILIFILKERHGQDNL